MKNFKHKKVKLSKILVFISLYEIHPIKNLPDEITDQSQKFLLLKKAIFMTFKLTTALICFYQGSYKVNWMTYPSHYHYFCDIYGTSITLGRLNYLLRHIILM